MESFCKTYMTLQGTEILKQNSKDSKDSKPSSAIKERRRDGERIVINQYERW
jgi:hypothetical protein